MQLRGFEMAREAFKAILEAMSRLFMSEP